MTKHPDMAGLGKVAHVDRGFALCKAKFGTVDGINKGGEQIMSRILKQGIPQHLHDKLGRVRFTHPNGQSVVVTPKSPTLPNGKIDFAS